MKSNKLQAVIFDWAGTIVDYGCLAPTRAFMKLFNKVSVPVTAHEVRLFMGLHKRDHIKGILGLPRVAEQYKKVYQKAAEHNDIENLFEQFVPIQIEELKNTDVIPGARETIGACRDWGMKIGSCTGYTKVMMEALAHSAQILGINLDAIVCSDEVVEGRPSPFMCFENMKRLSVYPASCMVKIGDTPEDIKEGLNASMWTIGLAGTGNLVGLSKQQESDLSKEDHKNLLRHAYDTLQSAGAHFVVDSVADVPTVLQKINQKLSHGERP